MNNNCLKTFFLKVNIWKLSFFHLILWVRFPNVHLTAQIFIWIIFFVCLSSCDFLHFLFFFIDFDGYYIVRTDEGQPRPKYIFNKCGTNIYFFTLQRCGPSPSPNFKTITIVSREEILICPVSPVYIKLSLKQSLNGP